MLERVVGVGEGSRWRGIVQGGQSGSSGVGEGRESRRGSRRGL